MKYKVIVQHSEYGYSVSYPFFPGCHSQGDTLEDALENIKDAISNYQEMLKDQYKNHDVHEVLVA